MTRRILFVAMQQSPHAARWINQLAGQGWDLHLFPVNYLPVIPELRGVTVHQPWFRVRPRKFLRDLFADRNHAGRDEAGSHVHDAGNAVPTRPIFPLPMVGPLERYFNGAFKTRLGESDARAPIAYGPRVLARLIRQLRPDLVHSMEFQHCGYNVLRAKELSGGAFPRWLATNWGSDIYYYRNLPDHRRQISRLLASVDYYSCECERDVRLARELGLRGEVLPVMPNSGGFDLARIAPLREAQRPSARRLVMVKGYQHFAGRALTALDAIARCADVLRGFRIVVFSASQPTIDRVAALKRETSLDIEVLLYASHEEMLALFARARFYLGVNISDAISTAMLEAMALGAFPIQTNTACCDEWIEDGRSGFAIPPDDVGLIADRVRRAATDDALVDAAAALNWATVQERLDSRRLKAQAIEFYDRIFADRAHRESAA
jgi:glycosyltransferase involved in cell wall biosynthesis